MIASLLLVVVTSIPLSVEAVGGLITPGLPYTDSPAMFCEIRLGAEIFEDWVLFTSVPFWSLSNFHPTSKPPDFFDYTEYNWFESYSESRLGIQLGTRRSMGHFALEIAAGVIKGTAKYKMDGVDDYGDIEEQREDKFLGSFNVVIPTGSNGLFSLGTKTEGFDDWYFTLGAGLTFSTDLGGE